MSKRLQLASILYLLHYGYAALQPFVNYIDEVFHDVVSILASPSAMFPVSVSEALMKRVQGTKGIHREVSAFGMMGAGRIISDGGGKVLISKISGPVNASVEVRNGEIGLREGEIYVGEGTLLMNAEGTKFSFIDGKWVLKN